MKVRDKIFRRKSGKSKGAWIVRVEYDDDTGRRRFLERSAASKTAARDIRDRLRSEVEKSHGHAATGERMTFNDLADYCEKHYYKPAEYHEGRKVSGVRSLASVKSAIASLRAYFGPRQIRSIYKTSVAEYKTHRLRQVSAKTKRQISIATVNRELAALRRMVKIALSEGWIMRDPFLGQSLINIADEQKRERILTAAEEMRLLAACKEESTVIETERFGKPLRMRVHASRVHLHPLIILALDTGMRRGELFKLRWEDVDLEQSVIRVHGTHTKTQRARIVPLTTRAKRELLALQANSIGERVFPFVDVKRSFKAVTSLAGLKDIRFHDLRHTAITRMVRGGISAEEAGKVAGHTQPATTYRYINTDLETICRVASVLDAYSNDLQRSEIQEASAVQ